MSKQHRTHKGQPSVASRLRTALSDLDRAGDIVVIDPEEYPYPLKTVRIRVSQAAKVDGLTVEMRTIDDLIHVKRTDFPQPATTLPGMALPGMALPETSSEDLLHALRPWDDDPHAAEKNHTLDRAIMELGHSDWRNNDQ